MFAPGAADPGGPLPRSARLAPPLLLLAAFALSLALACSLPLIDPDEGRNAEVAREMARDGDFVIPHLSGMPYLDKPPALFAAAALAVRAFGPKPWAARLPAALSATLLLWVMWRAGWRLGSTAFALRAMLLLLAAPLFATLSAYVILDMPLALCVTVVWTQLALEVTHGPDRRRRVAMFAAIAIGILVKGPVMLAWAAGGSLASAALLRSRAPLRWLAWWPGWLIVLGLAGGWFALATARHPEYPHYAFLEESLERLSRGTFKREQPWWFAPAVLVGGALPWTLATPWSVARARRAPAELRPSLAVALGFVLFAAVFFTLSRSKLVTYLLPAMPPLAWLAAAMWSDPAPRRRAVWVLAALYGLLFLASAARPMASMPGVPREGFVPLALGFGAAAAVAIAALVTRRRGLDLAAALLFTPILLALGHPLIASYARTQSGEPLARAVAPLVLGGALRFESCYSPGTDFLLDRRSAVVSPLGQGLTSNYQLRYRESLARRGMWTPLETATDDSSVRVIVRPAGEDPPPGGFTPFFRDHRFAAYRR